MKVKSIFLFLALVLPVLVFLFLKFFGKNEFAVEPLYVSTYPQVPGECGPVDRLPYHIPDSIRTQIPFGNDSLRVLTLGTLGKESQNELNIVMARFAKDGVGIFQIADARKIKFWTSCIFFLKKREDMVLLDKKGSIRGVYESWKREETDRLMTELTIILKRY